MTPCPRCGTGNADGRLALCPRCLAQQPLPPHRLTEWLELGDVLGEGGMGTVFAARDLRLGRDVAVKVLAPELAGDAESRARLQREARTLAQVSHPNLVTLLDAGEVDGECYLVMERVHGGPLSDALPLPREKAVKLLLEVCEAVGAAHRLGVVHRDLKPQNILVDEHGHAKVTDFGIARAVEGGGEPVTRAGGVMGTPAYLAPEALQGAAPDPRADVFSLGVVLYQTLTGKLPHGNWAPLPPGLEAIVRRALADDPGERYADAGAMAAALRQIDAREEDDALLPDQRAWLLAVAGAWTLATAVGFWALVACVTPRALAAGEVPPLVVLAPQALPDGRVLSMARFEVGPVLAAALATVVAFVSLALLRRHWRLSGVERARPVKARDARGVVVLGGAQALLYVAHRVSGVRLPMVEPLLPLVGGAVGLVTVWLFWATVLRQVSRRGGWVWPAWPWLGLALAAVPSVSELVRVVWRAGR